MAGLKSVLTTLVPEHVGALEEIRIGVDAVLGTLRNKGIIDRFAQPNCYYAYPYLFIDAFPGIDPTSLKSLAIAGVLYIDHICLLDDIVDEMWGQRSDQMSRFLYASSLLHERAILRLQPLFQHTSGFWQCLTQYHHQFARAMIAERSVHESRFVWRGEEEALEIARGKSCMSKGTTAAMAYLSGRSASLHVFDKSQDCFNIAMQLYDDVRDWRRDLKRGTYTLPLTRAIQLAGLSSRDAAAIACEEDMIGHHLYYSGIISNVLKTASDFCGQSVDVLHGTHAPKWLELTKMLREQIDTLARDLTDIEVKTQLRAHGYLTLGVRGLISRGTAYLFKEQDGGYSEAVHGMNFAELNMEAGENGLHQGCVFQRAIIADVLLDLRDFGACLDESRVAEDVKHLLAAKLQNVRGGWSYFPTLSELPPDADDLGQILQVLVRYGHSDIPEVVDDSLDLLFSAGLHADGSFETWIVDPNATDETSSRMKHSIEHAWGCGADVEVVANLSYALTLYVGKYTKHVRAAAKYVETKQDASGYWRPTWYSSCYYGTFVALRLLKESNPESKAFDRAMDFLTMSQRQDGGYGETHSSPLETAWALLCWSYLPKSIVTGSSDTLQRAIRYLELTIMDDGGWNASNFIKMDMNRAQSSQANARPRCIYYKSRTLTTAYVLKALTRVEA